VYANNIDYSMALSFETLAQNTRSRLPDFRRHGDWRIDSQGLRERHGCRSPRVVPLYS
jgi:hypothetical protein